MERLDNIEQGSQEWHDLRAKHIRTASRTPIVLGISPFGNIEKLAKEIKFNIFPFQNKAMQQGNDLEDTVRELVNKKFSDYFMPTVGINDNYLASLDGINFDEDTIIEIKVSEKTFEEVKAGKIPDYYMAQIQHQLMVFDMAKKAFLIAYSPSKEEIAISKPIYFEGDYEIQIKAAWDSFEKYLETYELPQANSLEDGEAVALALELFEVNEQKKQLELKEKELKEKLTTFVSSDKTTIGNLTISKQKGSKKIDYVRLISEKEVDVSDIDKYTSYAKESLVFRFGK